MASGGEAFVDRVVRLPAPQKAAVAAFLVAGITAGNYFLFVQPTQEQAQAQLARMKKLEEELIQNQAIANNLNQYRREKELLEQQLAKALAELPEEANIEALVESLYEIASKAGIVLNSIEPKGENRADFYAAIPLAIQTVGNYHEIAVFFDAISKLKRIVNITGIRMGVPRTKNEKVLVDAAFTATSFRFLEGEKKPEKKEEGKNPEKKPEGKK